MDAPLEVLERVEADAVPCAIWRTRQARCGYDARHRVKTACTGCGRESVLFVCGQDWLLLHAAPGSAAGNAPCRQCRWPLVLTAEM